MKTLRLRAGFLVLLLMGMALWFAGCKKQVGDDGAHTIRYVGREACVSCHAEASANWVGSDHDRAMAPATAETVLGDFNEAIFTQLGVETRFFQKEDTFFVRTEGSDGSMQTYPIDYVFGVRPLQQYLVAFSGGRLQALTVAWDTEQKRWFSLYPDERILPSEWLHWTRRAMNWNYMCAACHSTDLQKKYDLETDTYHTTFSEVDVSCEACHGPGDRHVGWAEAAEARGDTAVYTPEVMGLTTRLNFSAPASEQIDTCAPCHSRRGLVADGFVPGDRYLDHFAPALLDEGLYYPDGQIMDEVYVYGSFLQSQMYQAGVRCTNCHDPHTARLRLEGNSLCTQCHVADTFDVAAHHFHRPDSTGAACVACHMPERTYMQVDSRRDHGFKVPRPDLSVELGVPNACNGCHADKTLAWARDQVVAWYGPERPPTFAQALAAGRAGVPAAVPALVAVAGAPEQPAIVRATALSLLERYAVPESRAMADQALQDPEPLVRYAAVHALEGQPPAVRALQIAPLLEDSVRLVRAEAGRVLAQGYGTGGLPPPPAFERALREYRAGQEAVNDQASAHVNLAVLDEQQGDDAAAAVRYRTSLRLDSSFVPAHLNLATLLNRQRMAEEGAGNVEAAHQLAQAVEAQLKTAVRLQAVPVAETYYMLGLLLAEDPARLPEAAEQLKEAARLSPNDARLHYNTGLAYQQLKQPGEAVPFLLHAYDLVPGEPDFLNALAIFYIQQEQWQKALTYNEKLEALLPNQPRLQQRTAYIRAQMGS